MPCGRSTLAVPALLLAALIVTGCAPAASDAGAPTSSTGPSTPAPSMPSSSPTSTPTPTDSGSVPADWIITLDGVGPLTIGGSATSESIAASPPYERNAAGSCPNPLTSTLSSETNPTIWLQVSAEGADDLALVAVGGDGIDDIRAAGSPHTAEGIRVGSSIQEVQEAYPTGVLENDLQGEPTRVVVEGTGSDGAQRYLAFHFFDTNVQTILVQTSSQYVYEFCG